MCPDIMPDATPKDPGKEPLRIMLLGKGGAGKSSSGNTILNKKVFKADMKLARVTLHCEKEEGMAEDTPIAVIDTPGFFEKERNKKEIVRDILKCVKLQEPGPHAFVFVIHLGRMTQEDQDTIALIEAKFGPRVWDYTIVLFTHGDCLEGKTINDVITESDDNLRNFIRKCSGGFHVFNNKDPEDQTQVTTFIEKIHTMMALNGGTHYQTELYPEEERKIRKRQESILSERTKTIATEEKNLKEHYKGDELKMKMKAMWRKEEEDARKAAEKETSKKPSFMFLIVILSLVFVGLPISLVLQAHFWLLLAVALIGIVMLFMKFTTLPGKIPMLSKKNE